LENRDEIVSDPAAAIGYHPQTGGGNLIFDMHSEYGWEATSEETLQRLKACGSCFQDKCKSTLDPDSTKRRGVRDAQELYLGYDQIEVEDIMLVRNELNLSEASLRMPLFYATSLVDLGLPSC